jgi:hypothetical protein
MTTSNVKRGQVIGNVGILDIRTATAEAVAEIEQIGNVGVVIYTPETAHLIAQLNLGNMGVAVEMSGEVSLRMGQEEFGRDSFKNQAGPLHLAISGQAIIHPDVPAADIEQGLGSLFVMGQLLYPEHLGGTLQSKLRHLAGQMKSYKYAKLVVGNLTLDQSYLQTLEAGSELSVTGRLVATHLLPNDLLAQKIKAIEVFREIICREENAQTLLARLDNKSGTTQVTIIPTGFEPVEKELLLDAGLLAVLPGRKLYCRQLQIADDVTAEALDKALEQLIVRDALICPVALKGAIARKCNLLETQAIFYEGELWLNSEDFSLSAARFDYLAGKATLVNFGDVTIAPDIDPKLLADRLDKVYNFGDIFGTTQQIAAIYARLGTNKGDLIDSSQPKAEQDAANRIGNVGHLKL